MEFIEHRDDFCVCAGVREDVISPVTVTGRYTRRGRAVTAVVTGSVRRREHPTPPPTPAIAATGTCRWIDKLNPAFKLDYNISSGIHRS